MLKYLLTSTIVFNRNSQIIDINIATLELKDRVY